MIPNAIPTLVAAERQKALLAEADAYRQARQAREQRGSTGRSAVRRALSRGAVGLLRIRPIRAGDADAIRVAFERLSLESRRLRFLTAKHSLSESEIRYFTDVDHHVHEAFVATGRLTGSVLGVARYVRQPDDPSTADLAVTVVDDWQSRGLGTELLVRLSRRARCEGITRFTALMSADNVRARKLLSRLPGPVVLLGRDGATMTYEIRLTPVTADRRPTRRVLRHAPAGC